MATALGKIQMQLFAYIKMRRLQTVRTGDLVGALARQLTPSSALIPWVPNLPKRGTVDRRWGVVVNDGS